jgi:hypothetical protein
MKEPLAINLGDRVEMRKPHACGANRWTVLRTGIDIRLQCDQCRRTVLLPRTQFTRAVRTISPPEPPDETDPAGRPEA